MSEKTKNIKVVVVGESGVGKTCILSRFIHNTFDGATTLSTMANFASKTINYPVYNNTQLLLDIWDTAGQEKYRALTKFFYKEAIICVLVYDITRRESFDELKGYWYKQVQAYGDKKMIIGIAGNKADLYEMEAIPEEEARKFAQEIGAFFRYTSASNNSGIDELFYNLGAKYLDPTYTESEEIRKNRRETIKLKRFKNGTLKHKKLCC